MYDNTKKIVGAGKSVYKKKKIKRKYKNLKKFENVLDKSIGRPQLNSWEDRNTSNRGSKLNP